jgi:hypothetical protein
MPLKYTQKQEIMIFNYKKYKLFFEEFCPVYGYAHAVGQHFQNRPNVTRGCTCNIQMEVSDTRRKAIY